MPIPAIIGILAPLVGKIAGKFLKNKGKKAEFLAELSLKLAEQETQLIESLTKSDVAQAEINKMDATSGNKFQSYWRPSLAWICVAGFAWTVFLPVVSWSLQLAGVVVPDLPTLGGEALTSLTFGILGLGGYRTYEKKKGVTK